MNPTPFWRNLALALVLVNLLLWAWTQGHLRLLGLGPKPVEEPQRMQQQIQPQGLTLRSGEEGKPMASKPEADKTETDKPAAVEQK